MYLLRPEGQSLIVLIERLRRVLPFKEGQQRMVEEGAGNIVAGAAGVSFTCFISARCVNKYAPLFVNA